MDDFLKGMMIDIEGLIMKIKALIFLYSGCPGGCGFFNFFFFYSSFVVWLGRPIILNM